MVERQFPIFVRVFLYPYVSGKSRSKTILVTPTAGANAGTPSHVPSLHVSSSWPRMPRGYLRVQTADPQTVLRTMPKRCTTLRGSACLPWQKPIRRFRARRGRPGQSRPSILRGEAWQQGGRKRNAAKRLRCFPAKHDMRASVVMSFRYGFQVLPTLRRWTRARGIAVGRLRRDGQGSAYSQNIGFVNGAPLAYIGVRDQCC